MYKRQTIESVNYYDNYEFKSYNSLNAEYDCEDLTGYDKQYPGGQQGMLTGKMCIRDREYSSLSKGDTKNVIDNLVRVLTTHLQSSESVTLDGFGTFRMTMKSNGKGVESADKVSAAQATMTVRFLPCLLYTSRCV